MPKIYVVRVDRPKYEHPEAMQSPLSKAEYTAAEVQDQIRYAKTEAINNQWPKYLNVPKGDPIFPPINPEEWMKKEVLPNHPSSVCTLLEQTVVYEPATHKRLRTEE